MSVAQLGLMAQIAVASDDTMGALAQRSGLDQSTLSRNLRTLEHEGLIEIAIVETDLRRRMVTGPYSSSATCARSDFMSRARPSMAARPARWGGSNRVRWRRKVLPGSLPARSAQPCSRSMRCPISNGTWWRRVSPISLA